ncbi:MAG: PfkB family carbohydrate kinase [Candidatus Altiarchaeota archaeon]
MGLDLLVFGDTAIDNFYEVKKLPEANESADILKGHRFYGGMGANTAMGAKKLGLKVGLVSVIGTDAEDYREYMEDHGIKLYLKGIFGDTTKSMFYKTGGEHISFFFRGVTEQLDDLNPEKEFGKQLPKDVKAVYMARTYLEMHHRVVESYRNCLKVYNPGYGIFKMDRVPRAFKTVVEGSDVIVLNHHELKHLERLGFKIKPDKNQTLIVTKGAEGASVFAKDTRVDVPAYKTKVVDEAGAGDAFNAGLITGRMKGYDIYESVKLANATASYVVEAWGCQTNLPTWEQVLERYERIR